jgi:phosphoglycerate dehydrogenase-like enzyme
MFPPVTAHLIEDEHYRRLDRLCELPRREPIVDFADEANAELLASVEILITSWGTPRVGRNAIERMPALRLVVNAAGTVRWVISDSFWDFDVALCSAADANAVPVAEFTLATIILALKRAFSLQRRYAETREWRIWSDDVPWIGTRRRTVGIVGASRIGRRLIELLRPFEVTVQVYDPYLTQGEATELGVTKLELLDDLLASSHVVSLHAPLLPATENMLAADQLALLQDGAVLINTARGGLVDGDALTAELESGRIEAVLDVTEPEVLPEDSPLYELPNVFLTPHIAGAQGSETTRLMDLALDEVERFVAGQPLLHQVRREDLDRIA